MHRRRAQDGYDLGKGLEEDIDFHAIFPLLVILVVAYGLPAAADKKEGEEGGEEGRGDNEVNLKPAHVKRQQQLFASLLNRTLGWFISNDWAGKCLTGNKEAYRDWLPFRVPCCCFYVDWFKKG